MSQAIQGKPLPAPPRPTVSPPLDTPEFHVEAEPPAAGATTRAWDDVPLYRKVTGLIACGTVAGAGVGWLGAFSGNPVVITLGATATVALLCFFAKHWVWSPMQRLLDQLSQINSDTRPVGLAELPLNRHDEVGQLSRAIRTLTGWCIRDSFEARQLRRTIDIRVAEATANATRELQRMAMRDPLTNLGNRRFLDAQLEELVNSSLEARTDLICILIDVDNFKGVNDTLGHAAGDQLLVFLSRLIIASIRREDIAARLGGDEFLLLMPGCRPERAGQFARQLGALFRQHSRAALPADTQASLSIGIASLQDDKAATGHELIERADASLYAAKRNGKNRVIGG